MSSASRDPLERLLTVARGSARALALAFFASALIVVSVLTLRPPNYEARVSFVSAGSDAPRGGLGGVAAQFGIGLSLSSGLSGLPPKYFSEIASSSTLLTTIFMDSALAYSLDSLFGFDEDAPVFLADLRLQALRSRIISDASRETGVVTVRVRLPDRGLSLQVANRLVELVNSHNAALRAKRAEAEVAFLENRRETLIETLRVSETAMVEFLRRNRSYESDPLLQAEFRRVERELSLKQSLLQSVSQSLEQARVDAARTTPVILVTEPAYSPVRPMPRRRIFLGFMAGVLGALVTLFVLFIRRSEVPVRGISADDRHAM